MQRRDFLKGTLSVAALSSLPSQSLAKSSQWVSTALKDDMPIARVPSDEASSLDFNGDDITRPHDIFWDINGYLAKKGGEPAVTEELDVVVVGGGVAGLTSAYALRNKKIALLEQDHRFGGNCKGEIYKDACYSIGSAYLCEPGKDSSLGKLLTELNIWDKARTESGQDTTVFYNGAFKRPFWQGASAPGAEADFKKFNARMLEIANDENFDASANAGQNLDKLTMDQWIAKEFGQLHPHIMEYLQLYGWSSFCGSTDELSASQFLSFIAAETSNLMAFPGGNAYIAHKMVQKIRQDAGENSLRSACIVIRVQTEGDAVTVLYEDVFGVLKKIRAAHVIMACPKYVAKRIVPELGAAQRDAMQALPYRAYLVANIFTKKPIQCPSYELYCLRGKMPPSPSAAKRPDRSFTDICYGSWAQEDKTEHGVLTLYQGTPYDGARGFLFNPLSHDKYKKQYLTDIEPVLAGMGLSSSDIHGIRLTRFGHALPLSRSGLLAEGTAQLAASSVGGHIHFANQDNTMTPSFESAFYAALEVADLID